MLLLNKEERYGLYFKIKIEQHKKDNRHEKKQYNDRDNGSISKFNKGGVIIGFIFIATAILELIHSRGHSMFENFIIIGVVLVARSFTPPFPPFSFDRGIFTFVGALFLSLVIVALGSGVKIGFFWIIYALLSTFFLYIGCQPPREKKDLFSETDIDTFKENLEQTENSNDSDE